MPTAIACRGDERETVPVLRPRLPTAERLLPYLRRIDLTRIYSNHGPLGSELAERLASMLQLPEGGIVCAGSGTAALAGAVLATAGRGTPARPLALLPAFTFVATAAAVEHCDRRRRLPGDHPSSASRDN
jgi:dTDP-4-amino-4,6-dideoxygalactose transaminase